MSLSKRTELKIWSLAVLATTFASAVSSGGAAPSAVPAGYYIGDPTAAQIDHAALTRFPEHPHSGFSLAIAHGGKIVYETGYGYRDYGTPDTFDAPASNVYGANVLRGNAPRAKADANTIYEIGSVTKQFTAAAIVMLSERGKLAMTDRVGKYIPEFANDPVTLENLLHQRSGLPEFNTPPTIAAVRNKVSIVRWIAMQPRSFAADARFEYSNSNYVVLQEVAQRVSGEPLGTFLDKNIFKPLGMSRTAFGHVANSDDVAVGYTVREHTVERAYPWDLDWAGGAGAITSTAHDLALWDVALMGGRVIHPGNLAHMLSGPEIGRLAGDYGYGWVAEKRDDHRYIWHNGEVGGFHAVNGIFPDDSLAIVMLGNNDAANVESLVVPIAALYIPLFPFATSGSREVVDDVMSALAAAMGTLIAGVFVVLVRRRYVLWGILGTLAATVAGLIISLFCGASIGVITVVIPLGFYMWFTRNPKKIKPEQIPP